MTRALRLSLFVLLAACNKKPTPTLPNEIPYRVNFYDADKGHVISAVPSLGGASLTLNGEPVAKLQDTGGGSTEVLAFWKGPKTGVNAVVGGTFAIRVQGGCGPFEVKIEGPPESWRPLKDDALAPYLHDGELQFSNWITVPPKLDVLVDRGASTAEVKIGQVLVTEKEATVTLGGCTEPLPVLVGGEKVGEIDLKTEAVLVTLEPAVCHTVQQIGYGSYKSGELRKLAAAPVTKLDSKPVHFLEKAPDSTKVGGGGTVTSELLRAPCATE